jgi:hypothetical protein
MVKSIAGSKVLLLGSGFGKAALIVTLDFHLGGVARFMPRIFL